MSTLPLFPTPTEWIPPDHFPNLREAKEIAIDLETCDPNLETYGPGWPRHDGFIVGYAVAVDGWSGYFPVAHAGGGNLDKGIVERWISDTLKTPAVKIMHNAAYDLGWLLASGFVVHGPIVDTMLAAPLLDENRFSYSLNALGFDYLQETKSEAGLRQAAADFGVHPKKELWKLPAMYVGEYAEQDAALTLRLWQQFKILLRKEEVESIWHVEKDVFPALMDITFKGIRFDRQKAARLIEELKAKEKQAIKAIKDLSGVGVDIWAAASISKAFDKLGIGYPKTTTGLPSFTKSFLDSHEHPIAKLITEAREYNKTHGTFLEPYLQFSAKTGRIHPHINQLRSDEGGTVTGRLSMAQPNLQQVPARHEIIGPLVRGLFLPEEEELWGSIDFSSQEPRILIHYAHLLGLPGTDEVVKAYRENPRTDFYQIVADAANVPRKVAKTCIAEGQLVLTDTGLVPIEKVTTTHKVWDGVEWVNHDGVVFMGNKEVITYGNLTATPDHDIWTVESGKISIGLAASRLETPVRTGNAGQAIRYVDSGQQGDPTSWQASLCKGAMRLWHGGLEAFRQLEKWKIYNVPTLQYAQATCGKGPFSFIRQVSSLATREIGRNISALFESQKRWMEKLWWTRYSMRISERSGIGGIPGTTASSKGLDGVHHRSNKQRRELCEGEYSTGYLQGEQLKQKTKTRVYDILNAGPRHRFTVSGALVSNCSLGMMYGMGKSKLASSLDLQMDEAEELITKFHHNVPFLKGTVNAVMRRIEHPASNGSIRTLLGRKCRFNLWEPMEWGVNKALPREQAVAEYGHRVKRAYTYKGLNRLIQGSAADQTKAGMVALHKEGFRILLQVHDEVVVSVKSKEEAERASRIMADAVRLEVPSRCDVEVGPSWGEAK